jgi:hypothetical protein
MGLSNYARSGQGSSNVSKSKKARAGNIEKAYKGGKPFPGAATPFGGGDGDDEGTPVEETATEMKSMGAYARAGQMVLKVAPMNQPRVASNIPGSDSQGVPAATRDEMGAFARRGNLDNKPKVVAAQTGLGTQGPAVASSLARMGGQIGLAPGQFGVWAHPKDPTTAPARSESKQVTSQAGKPGSLPKPAKPVY